MTLRGTTLNSAEPIGTACVGHVGDQQARRLSAAHLADQALADAQPLRMAVGAVVGIGRAAAAAWASLRRSHLVDDAQLRVHQRRELATAAAGRRWRDRAGPAACW